MLWKLIIQFNCKEHWIVMGWLIISKLNATCLAIKTVTSPLLREDSRTLYYSLRAFSYSGWCNILCRYEEIGNAVLCCLCFVGFITKCTYDTIFFYDYITVTSRQVLYPIGWVDLVWINRMQINEWMNEWMNEWTN